jgi:hypothetical protein
MSWGDSAATILRVEDEVLQFTEFTITTVTRESIQAFWYLCTSIHSLTSQKTNLE